MKILISDMLPTQPFFTEPTGARPGSPEKLKVMSYRADRRQPLFHPLDAGVPNEMLPKDGQTYTLISKHLYLRSRPGANENVQDYYVQMSAMDGEPVVKTFPIDSLDDAKAFVEEILASIQEVKLGLLFHLEETP